MKSCNNNLFVCYCFLSHNYTDNKQITHYSYTENMSTNQITFSAPENVETRNSSYNIA